MQFVKTIENGYVAVGAGTAIICDYDIMEGVQRLRVNGYTVYRGTPDNTLDAARALAQALVFYGPGVYAVIALHGRIDIAPA